jgi:hypothetical protein
MAESMSRYFMISCISISLIIRSDSTLFLLSTMGGILQSFLLITQLFSRARLSAVSERGMLLNNARTEQFPPNRLHN